MPSQWRICRKSDSSHHSVCENGRSGALFSTPSLRNRLTGAAILFILFFANAGVASIVDRSRIVNGGYVLSVNDTIIEQYHGDTTFVPASTIKLLTALTALKILGPDFRFETRFHYDYNRQILTVVGGGDPLLTSETLNNIALELKRKGITTVRSYVLNDSLFKLEHNLPAGSMNSHNPYDAANSALAANFNTIAIRKKKNGTIVSAERQTPTTELAREIGKKLPVGSHRVNISAYPLTGQIEPSLRYVAELLHEKLKLHGISSILEIRHAESEPEGTPILIHVSDKPVREIVRLCLHYSNNFIANQLALVAGGTMYGFPATWQKAKLALEHVATTLLHIAPDHLRVEEGSGLSRTTRASPMAIMQMLKAFSPYGDLLPVKNGARIKSGTLDGVYCYAGYLETQSGEVLFCFLLNQKTNNRDLLLNDIKRHFNVK